MPIASQYRPKNQVQLQACASGLGKISFSSAKAELMSKVAFFAIRCESSTSRDQPDIARLLIELSLEYLVLARILAYTCMYMMYMHVLRT